MAEGDEADLDAILGQAEVGSRQEAARRDWAIAWERLFLMSNEARGFSAEMMEHDLGRRPSPEEVAEHWGRIICWFGQILVQYGAAGWPDDLPRATDEEVFARELLRLSCRPDGEQELFRQLTRLHGLGQSRHAFYSQVRERLRHFVDLLLNRARETFGPLSARPRHVEHMDAFQVDPASIATPSQLREWCQSLQEWFPRKKELLGHTSLGREALLERPGDADNLIQKVWACLRRQARGCTKTYPDQPPSPSSLDEAVRQLDPVIRWCVEREAESAGPDYPHSFPLVEEKNARKSREDVGRRPLDFQQTEMVSLGFAWNWWLPLDLARQWRSDTYPATHSREAVNQWRTYMQECVSFANVGQAMRAASGNLQESLANDLNLLRRFDPTLVEGEATSSPVPTVDEILSYKVENQPWWTPIPPTKEVPETELLSLADEINVVLMTATEVERDAVLRLLKPLPPWRKVLTGFIGPETYYVGKFGAFKAVVTKCRPGSVDPGAATLAANEARRLWHPRAIIMPGIAFGKDPTKQTMADLLVASQVISYEQQRVGGEIIDRGSIPPSNPTLLNRFEHPPGWSFARPDGSPCKLHIGPILSGEKLVDDPEFKASLLHRFPQAIGGEMEGAGLCAAAIRGSVPWILVKAICDWADGKKHGKHQPLAAAAAVSLVHHVLSQPTVLNGLEKVK